MGLLLPTKIFPTLHWYFGPSPPFIAAAVKVTLWPVHTAPTRSDVIVIEGTTESVVEMVILLLVAVDSVAHEFELVSTQLTISPFDNVLLLYVPLFDPTLIPLSFH